MFAQLSHPLRTSHPSAKAPWRSLGIAVAALLALPALADTYTFTGTNYTSAYLSAPGPTGGFTAAMRPTGSFTTSAPLPPNMPLTAIGPGASPELVTAWSFSDGMNTFTNANSGLIYGLPQQFAVATDAAGQITDFSIILIRPRPPHTVGQVVQTLTIETLQALAVADAQCQFVASDQCRSIAHAGTLASALGPGGGTWVRVAAPAAVPTLSLVGLAAMGAAVAGMAGWARRRRRG